MLVNIHHDSRREHNRLLVAGVVFLTVIALLIGFSIAIYQKTFERNTTITIEADRAGLQLAKFGDVRVNGALIGQVRGIEQDGKNARITVALRPEAAKEIPSNVSVEILPTTLFGQKFISFVMPGRRPRATRWRTATSSRRTGSTPTSSSARSWPTSSRCCAPSVPPTSTRRSTRCRPRSTAAASSSARPSTTSRSTSARSTSSLPTLREDLVRLADVADTYNLAAPDLLAVLRNLTVTSRTVVERRADLDMFFSDISGLAKTSTRILADNEQAIIQVGEVTEPLLKLLAVYSPEFPCLIKGAARYDPILSAHLRGQRDQAVHRVRHQPVPRLHRVRDGRVRRGRPRSLVPGTARTRRSRPGRSTSTRASSPTPSARSPAVASAPRRTWPAASSSGYAGSPADQAHRQRPAGQRDRPGRRLVRRPRLARLRPRRPRG